MNARDTELHPRRAVLTGEDMRHRLVGIERYAGAAINGWRVEFKTVVAALIDRAIRVGGYDGFGRWRRDHRQARRNQPD